MEGKRKRGREGEEEVRGREGLKGGKECMWSVKDLETLL